MDAESGNTGFSPHLIGAEGDFSALGVEQGSHGGRIGEADELEHIALCEVLGAKEHAFEEGLAGQHDSTAVGSDQNSGSRCGPERCREELGHVLCCGQMAVERWQNLREPMGEERGRELEHGERLQNDELIRWLAHDAGKGFWAAREGRQPAGDPLDREPKLEEVPA